MNEKMYRTSNSQEETGSLEYVAILMLERGSLTRLNSKSLHQNSRTLLLYRFPEYSIHNQEMLNVAASEKRQSL